MAEARDAAPLPIALVGLRCSGKSTIGRELARQLSVPFLDLDDEVALIAGAESAGAVLEEMGLETFRRLESRALERVLTEARRPGGVGVLATGGGVVESPVNRQWLALSTRCVWLRAELEVLRERLRSDPTSRPSLTGADPADELQLLRDRRAPLFEAVARMRQLYDAEITLVDTELARVIAAARERAGGELWIAVTSDHGESFGEHGIWYRRELYDASLHVPLILATPASGPKGVRVREQARLTDLAPTLLDALGLSWRFEGEGVSLLPLARGEKSPIPGPSISAIYSSHADPYQRFLLAVRNDRWKSIWRSPGWANSDALFAAETRELYDLEADPGELNNQSSAQPDLWQGLRDMAGEVQMDMRSDASLSPAELDVLRQLGYTN